MEALVEQEHIVKEIDAFFKETLVTEKSLLTMFWFTLFSSIWHSWLIFSNAQAYSRWTLSSFPRSYKYHDQNLACKEPLYFQCQVCLW